MARPQDKYKLSRYNVFHQDDDTQYMWNTYSDALLELDKDAQKYIENFSGVDDGSTEFTLLRDNGFIVYEQLDEFGRVCLEEKHAMFNHNPSSLYFVIAPGMGCNYKCSYCFEKNSDLTGVMTSEIAIEVAEYICQQLQNSPNAKNLNIRWFGGEPLLYLDSIEIISRKIIEYTQQNGIKYSANIFTNGRLLDSNILDLFHEFYINFVHITVDGMRDVYCKSKGAPPEDFDCVINNICRSAEKFKLFIRLNVPNNDAHEAIKITDYLLMQCNLKDKVFVHLAYVCDYSLHPDAADRAFTDYVQSYFQWANHMRNIYGISKAKFLLPTRRIVSCGLIEVSNACIGPRGELYKCEHCIGIDAKICGNIWNDKFFNDAELAYCSTVDCHQKNSCSACEYLPVCMGGCANDRLNDTVKSGCKSNKRFLYGLKLLEGGITLVSL